ncbi:hypothetical protein LT493_20725 [Streptomyces tricolor]|nr:hypothetical protein [Streptomyces tricolor]
MIFFVEAPLTGSGLSTLAWAVAQGIDAALVTTDPAAARGAAGAGRPAWTGRPRPAARGAGDRGRGGPRRAARRGPGAPPRPAGPA